MFTVNGYTVSTSPVGVQIIGSSDAIVDATDPAKEHNLATSFEPEFIGYQFDYNVDILQIKFTTLRVVKYEIVLITESGPMTSYVSVYVT